MVNGIEPPFYM